jgi:hypothetical protein
MIDGDDLVENFRIPTRFLPLDGWSSWTIGMKYFDNTSQNYVNVSGGSSTVTVVDSTLGIIRVVCDNVINVINYQTAETQKLVMAQVQALDSEGFKRTVLEIQITVGRDYNFA